MKWNQYRKLPENLFGLLFWNVFSFLMPIFLVLSLLALFGIKPIEFNDEPTYGILGVLWAIIFGPLFSLLFTVSVWIFLAIGNFIFKLFLRPPTEP